MPLPLPKIHSDTERQFAVLLENESDVLKWFKPTRKDFRINYTADSIYEPDFVVETTTQKLLCETKMEKDINTDEVKQKENAAKIWCQNASEHENKHNGKPWTYLLIPHNAIKPSTTLNGLISQFEN